MKREVLFESDGSDSSLSNPHAVYSSKPVGWWEPEERKKRFPVWNFPRQRYAVAHPHANCTKIVQKEGSFALSYPLFAAPTITTHGPTIDEAE